MVYYTRRVRMDQTTNKRYGLLNAKAHIINDLIYRHWNTCGWYISLTPRPAGNI